MNLSVRTNVNTHSRPGDRHNEQEHIVSIGGRDRNLNREHDDDMSLRNLFANGGREDSLRLEDLSSPKSSIGSVEKQRKQDQEQDAGLAAAMSIARLFVSDATRRERFAPTPQKPQYEDMTPEGLEEHDGEGEGPAEDSPEDDDESAGLDERRLQKVLDKINAMRSQHDELLRRERLRADDLERENATLRSRLRRAAADVDDRHAMAEYAKLIAEQMHNNNGKVSDSQYVLKLQSQLCRSLHKMGVLTNQIELLESQRDADDRVKTLQSQLVEQGNESFRAEVEHMNDLLEMEKEMECLKEEHESESSVQQGAIAKMEVELELERSLRCDALSYVRRSKDERDDNSEGGRRAGRRARRRRREAEDRERSRQAKKRMSKRDSEVSDATDVVANTSSERGMDHNNQLLDSEDEQIRNELAMEPFLVGQLVAGTEVEMPLNFDDSDVSDEEQEDQVEQADAERIVSEDERQASASSGQGTAQAEEGREEDADASSQEALQLRLEESLRTIEELRTTVTQQRRTIERLVLDHDEHHPEQETQGQQRRGDGSGRRAIPRRSTSA